MDTASQAKWTGVQFPFHFDIRTGKVATSSTDANNIDHIIESIYQILGTTCADPYTRKGGERVMLPEFGARIRSLVFAVADDTLLQLAKHETLRALLRWEPRINPYQIDAEYQDADGARRLIITIHFEVLATKQLGEAIVNFPVRS